VAAQDGKPDFEAVEPRPVSRDRCGAPELETIQRTLFDQARDRREANIERGVASFDDLASVLRRRQALPGLGRGAMVEADRAPRSTRSPSN
jgi:hypothetical protein